MNKILTIFSLLVLVSTSSVFAHGDEEHAKGKAASSSHDSIEKADVLISGQLVGLTCYIKHDSKGSNHKDCFKDCAEKGLPIGILTKDNKIYQISGEGHADLRETNKKFLKYAEEQVAVKGKVFTSSSVNMIIVNGIKKAK